MLFEKMGEQGQLVDKKRGGLYRRHSSLELSLCYRLRYCLTKSSEAGLPISKVRFQSPCRSISLKWTEVSLCKNPLCCKKAEEDIDNWMAPSGPNVNSGLPTGIFICQKSANVPRCCIKKGPSARKGIKKSF